MISERLQGKGWRLAIAGMALALLVLSGACSSSDDTTTPPPDNTPTNPPTGPTGSADTGFDSDGIVVFDSGNGLDIGNFVVVDSAGNVLIAGQMANASGDQDMALWRYTSAGALDTTFNSTGYVADDGYAAGRHETADSLALDASGNLVVTGSTDDSNVDPDLAVWRYTADGALDTTFDTDGIAVADSGGYDEGAAVVIDGSGNIVVAGGGAYLGVGGDEMTIWRFMDTGALDLTFNTTGYASYGAPAGNEFARGIALDGTTVVTAGTSGGAGSADGVMALWRFSDTGAIDSTFATAGVATYDGGAGEDRGSAVAVDADGRYVVAGFVNPAGAGEDIAVWRFNADGTPDTTFGTNGMVTFDGPDSGWDEAGGIALQPGTGSDYKILVAGYATNASNELQMVLVRFDADGTLDTTFNDTGYILGGEDAGGKGDPGLGIVVQSYGFNVTFGNNRIYVVGLAVNANGDADMVVWSFNP